MAFKYPTVAEVWLKYIFVLFVIFSCDEVVILVLFI